MIAKNEKSAMCLQDKSDTFYQNLIDTSIDGYALVDRDGRFQDANLSLCNMIDYDRKELLKLSIREIESQDQDCIKKLETECSEKPREITLSFIKKDGSILQTEIKGSSQGDGQGWILFFKEGTHNGQYKLDKNTVPHLLKELFNLTPNIIYLYDLRANKNLFANISIGEMLGYSSKEIKKMKENLLPILMQPDDFDNYLKNIVPRYFELKEGEVLQHSYRVQHKSGNWVWLESKESIFKRDEKGQATQMIGVCSNITEKQMYLHNLEQDRGRLLAIMDGIEDVIYISDPDTFELLHVNKAFKDNWGNDVIGKKCYKVMQSRNSPCPFCTNNIIFGEKLGDMHLWEFQNEVNKNWYRCADKAIRWINGKMVRFELATDISKLKNLQAQVVDSNEKLKHSNEELEQFAYIASHDLQEPLRMVSSYSQLLAKRYTGQLDEKADMYIHYAVDGALRMQQLINDLLEFSRVTTRGDDFIETDCHDILGRTLLSLKHKIDEAGAIIVNDDLPNIFVDPIQIERVFLNLISNALKFRRDEKPIVHISCEKKDDCWQFSVKDNGIGIDKKFKEVIFILFQRLHTRRESVGTGIGLAVCKRIINRHKGAIWLDSTLGKGTTFYFTIPIKQ
ncbi:MAG: PAS domain S-box protein [Marinilabiliaceae bacterium]|nr:PAS domain S-box protein [Marinilabiliaceae bacterium]